MSLNRLILNNFKPWLNIRVNNHTVDGDLNVAGSFDIGNITANLVNSNTLINAGSLATDGLVVTGNSQLETILSLDVSTTALQVTGNSQLNTVTATDVTTDTLEVTGNSQLNTILASDVTTDTIVSLTASVGSLNSSGVISSATGFRINPGGQLASTLNYYYNNSFDLFLTGSYIITAILLTCNIERIGDKIFFSIPSFDLLFGNQGGSGEIVLDISSIPAELKPSLNYRGTIVFPNQTNQQLAQTWEYRLPADNIRFYQNGNPTFSNNGTDMIFRGGLIMWQAQ